MTEQEQLEYTLKILKNSQIIADFLKSEKESVTLNNSMIINELYAENSIFYELIIKGLQERLKENTN